MLPSRETVDTFSPNDNSKFDAIDGAPLHFTGLYGATYDTRTVLATLCDLQCGQTKTQDTIRIITPCQCG